MSQKLAAGRPKLQQLTRLVYDKHGPLTRELLLNPSRFGLASLPDLRDADTTTRAVCGFCSTGCGLNIHLRDGQAVGLSPATDYPVNLGMACPKGWQALDVLDSPDRATAPLIRSQGRDSPFVPTSWRSALQLFCSRSKQVQQQHGPEAFAFLSTGQIPTEEMAFLGCLAKFGMGMRHCDSNTRQCMATAAVAYKQSFGFDAPPYTYADFEESDVLVFVGANPCIAHPIMWERVTRNPHDPQIIVVDPRATETAMQASSHLPLKPKSDLTLFYGVARQLIQQGWIDTEFISQSTSGFEDFAEFLKPYSLEFTAAVTGLDEKQIRHLAETIHRGRRVSFWWTMGINQSHEGVRTAQALINLALLTGNIGRPGTGANSITGQCNAMGSRLFSNTTTLVGGHDFGNPIHRAKVASILGLSEDSIPTETGWAYDQIVDAIHAGQIRGLWVIATNTAHSWIDQSDVRKALSKLDFLVVQDMYHTTETAQQADLILPAAGWGEKEGTFINSERRLGTLKAVRKAPGQALSDFRIFRLIADAWGCGDLFADWTSPEAVFQKLKQLSAGQPCDITGIRDYAMLDRCGGIQWPLKNGEAAELYPAGESPDSAEFHPSRDSAAERRLFADGAFFHDDRRAKFLFEASLPMAEMADNQYPFLLLTGRGTASQWHTQTRTRNSAILRKLYPEDPYLEINSLDATPLGLRDGDLVRVSSRRGVVTLRAVVTPSVRPGQVFAPMHYDGVNQLTRSSFDPYSRQPSYKACAVRLQPVKAGREAEPRACD